MNKISCNCNICESQDDFNASYYNKCDGVLEVVK